MMDIIDINNGKYYILILCIDIMYLYYAFILCIYMIYIGGGIIKIENYR